MFNLLRLSGRLVCVALFIALAGSLTGVAAAQRVAILDFSATVSKPRKHPPKPLPPDKISGGRGGGITSGKLIAAVVAMDKTEYVLGDEFNYTLELTTAGTETVKVPTVFNVADLEPDDPNVSFSYEAMEIWLHFSEETGEKYLGVPVLRLLGVPLLRLYGSDEMPWTQVELKPGTFIEIRGKAKLKPLDPERRLDTEVRFFDAPQMGSTEDLPRGEVRVSATCWRGDKFYYEGSTHYEYVGDFIPEERYTVVYDNKITLLPEPRQ
jgi:hypothetical protein